MQFLEPEDFNLSAVKEGVSEVLRKFKLENLVSLEEIEQALETNEEFSSSLLLLGLLARCDDEKDDVTLNRLIPSLTHWKNLLPRADLGGLSPFEFMQKYPPGPMEQAIIGQLMLAYEDKLKARGENTSIDDLNKDFKKFQDNFLNLIPASQLSAGISKPLSHRGLIIEERKQRSVSKDKINDIGINLFASNIGAKITDAIEKIDDDYIASVQALGEMQKNEDFRNRKKIKKIFEKLKEAEPFMRCTKESYRFYCNFAQVVFLMGDVERALELLRRAIGINPKYELAQIMVKRIENF